VLLQIVPTWVPALPVPLWKRIAVILPFRVGENTVPSSTADDSAAVCAGTSSANSDCGTASGSLDTVRKVQVLVASAAPPVEVTPLSVAVRSASCGSGDAGVNVNRVASVLRLVVPAIGVEPFASVIAAPGLMAPSNHTATAVDRGTPIAPGAGSWAEIEICGAGRSNTTSTR
jgi:hypothetical protein